MSYGLMWLLFGTTWGTLVAIDVMRRRRVDIGIWLADMVVVGLAMLAGAMMQ